nr:MAG: putative minor capsid protein [Lake Baikal virophage 11]
MAYSYKSIIDGGSDTDMIYYNALITSSGQRGTDSLAPAVRFNESRDAPIVKNASQYYFSIIRFSMNGPNKNLPLFIPLIQLNSDVFPVQNDPNLTIYSTTIPYQREWYFEDSFGAIQTHIFTITPNSTSLVYIPETQNLDVAPVPFIPISGFEKQDISTRYYWVYTYKHWATLVNNTMLAALTNTYNEFKLAWNAYPDMASTFPYPTIDDFLVDHDAPFIQYNESEKRFEIYGDTRAFNMASQCTATSSGVQSAVPAFVPPAVPVAPLANAIPASDVYLRLFFNTNLFGLLTNFNNTFYGAVQGDPLYFPLTGATPVNVGGGLQNDFCKYTNEILFTNQNYTNILNNNPLLQGLNAVPPPSYNPFFLIPAYKQNLYWISRQDYNSTNSLWSPCAGLVFTSSLLPVKNEYTSRPVVLGTTNIGSTNSPSAFEPIIADFVVDQQQEKAEGWRDFTLYEPTAEYRLSSIQASHDEIRNLDINVYWRYRLTGELIPLTMFNCSDVSIKILFRKTDFRS